jgi:hypothetical protein
VAGRLTKALPDAWEAPSVHMSTRILTIVLQTRPAHGQRQQLRRLLVPCRLLGYHMTSAAGTVGLALRHVGILYA